MEGNNEVTLDGFDDTKARHHSKAKVDSQFAPAVFAIPQQELDAAVCSAAPWQVGYEIKAKEPVAFCEYNSVCFATAGRVRVARPAKIVAERPCVAQLRGCALRPVASRVLPEDRPGSLAESRASHRQQAPDQVVTFAKKHGRLIFEIGRGKAHQHPKIGVAYAKLSCHSDRVGGKSVAQRAVAQEAPQGPCEVNFGHGVVPTLRIPRPSPLRRGNPCHVPG